MSIGFGIGTLLIMLVNLALVVLGVAVLVLSIKVLLLLIQALRIYIQKKQRLSEKQKAPAHAPSKGKRGRSLFCLGYFSAVSMLWNTWSWFSHITRTTSPLFGVSSLAALAMAYWSAR